ncbi:PLANT/F24K9-26 PROTEIN [Salix purpurea]|uniref:PLANT/F24K9-26 PROTEIN n=1 Tax=Salix purpurea TaxID=77065 RepID=A0A9Q0WH43_SALPP|nr:PLANT/F24K9-26 PROTEIN [Salix purpurea]
MEAKNREQPQCKIRKRGNSSSSSSSLVKKNRFKRAILAGKRGGSGTPVPLLMTSSKSPTMAAPNAESTGCTPPQDRSRAREVPVSARKLAANLWEINGIASPRVKKCLEDKKEVGSRVKVARLPHLSDPSYTPFSERMERSRGHCHRRRTSVVTQTLQLTDYHHGGQDSVGNSSLMEIESHQKGRSRTIGIRTCLKDVSDGLSTSKELLKVLNHVCGLEEKHSPGLSLVSALRIELDRACISANQLIKEHRSNRSEIEYLVKHFEEEKAAWKNKERDRIRSAIACIAEELEIERKLRRQTERLNKKLGKELADTKESLSKAMKELETEKRAKEILEQVCDELARGIGEERAEVEEMKKESAMVRNEVEKEREMLHLADVLREERVQMKLSEAKYHFEEKNAAVESLRNELETYLREKVGEKDGDGSPNYDRIRELEAYLEEIQFGSCQQAEREENEGGVTGNGEVHDGEDDSADSDLHSIELNMDNNSKSYKWGYASEDNPKWFSGGKDFKGRKSISDNIQWGNICLQKRNPCGVDGAGCDLISENQARPDMPDQKRVAELGFHSQEQGHGDDEIRKYKSVKTLKEHIFSGPKRSPLQNFASPTRRWRQSLPFQESGGVVSDSSPVIQGNNLKPGIAGTGGNCRTSTSSRH